METAGKEAQTQGTAHFPGIAFARADVQHGRDAAAVFGRNGTLVQFCLGHQVRVERRQDAENVVGVKYRTVVVQDEVLVHRAAADVEARGGLSHRLHARKGQHGLDDIGLTKCSRDFLDAVCLDLFHADACRPVQGNAFGRYGGSLEGDDLLAHLDVQAAVFKHLHFQADVFHGIAAEIQVVVSGGDLHAPEAVTVCHGVSLGLFVKDRDAHQGFGRGFVPDITMDDGFSTLLQVFLVSNLIDFVQVGGGHILFLHGGFRLLGTVFLEPVRAHGREEGMAVHNVQAAIPFSHGIAGRTQFTQGLIQELGTRSLHTVSGRVILGPGNEEAVSRHQAHHLHQGIGRYHADAHRVALGTGGQGHKHPQEKEDTNAFHGIEQFGWRCGFSACFSDAGRFRLP